MSYEKKTWLPRQGTGLNKFIVDGLGKVGITSSPDTITQEGTPLSAENFNDLEDRIKAGFDEVASDFVPNTRTINGKNLESNISLNAEDIGLSGKNIVDALQSWFTSVVETTDTAYVTSDNTVLTLPSVNVGQLTGLRFSKKLNRSNTATISAKAPSGGTYVLIADYTEKTRNVSLPAYKANYLFHSSSASYSAIGFLDFVYQIQQNNTVAGGATLGSVSGDVFENDNIGNGAFLLLRIA